MSRTSEWNLEGRFLCLSHTVTGPLPFIPGKCCKIIFATACLHNKARSLGLRDLDIEVEDLVESDETPFASNDIALDGNQSVRNHVINFE